MLTNILPWVGLDFQIYRKRTFFIATRNWSVRVLNFLFAVSPENKKVSVLVVNYFIGSKIHKSIKMSQLYEFIDENLFIKGCMHNSLHELHVITNKLLVYYMERMKLINTD